MTKPLYSIVIPVYNSASTIEELTERLCSAMDKTNDGYEIIFVHDAGTDNSWEKIKASRSRHSDKITGINLKKNTGQHNATLCGINVSSGDFVINIDDDLQQQPEDILLLIERQKQTDADLVYGVYDEKKHSAFRNLGSRGIALLFEKFGSTTGNGSSFRLMKRSVAEKLAESYSPYTFLDELLAWHASGVEFVKVEHTKRSNGKSGYGLFKLLKLAFQVIVTYTALPLRFISYFGLLTFLVCLVLVGFFIYQKVTVGAELGFTALIVSIFMSTGLIMFCLGIVGEYLNRIFVVQNKKPPYMIATVLKRSQTS
jgi:glycosyltransferase involved in cell wall biosynthesis